MELQALGYVGLNARNLDDWAGFGVNFLGMELVERTRSMLALRMDDRRQRLVIQSDDVPPFFGWEVADAAALGALAARLEAAGVRVERLPQALPGARRDGASARSPLDRAGAVAASGLPTDRTSNR